jgi:hypothetical protein
MYAVFFVLVWLGYQQWAKLNENTEDWLRATFYYYYKAMMDGFVCLFEFQMTDLSHHWVKMGRKNKKKEAFDANNATR